MFLIAIMTSSCIAIVGLVTLSPFALVGLAHFRHDWSQLSNIGQTYGAISALVSSLALGGVIVSLLFQARDNQNAREQTTRTLQHELIKLEMDDPALLFSLLGSAIGDSIYRPRVGPYVISFMFRCGSLSGEVIILLARCQTRMFARSRLASSFGATAGRNYWVSVGQVQMEGSTGRRNRFFRLLEEEVQEGYF